MVYFKRYFFLLSLILLFSCSKPQFTLDLELAPEIKENYNVTYYATDTHGGKTIQAVAPVIEGKCVLEGLTKSPCLVYITQKKEIYPLVLIADKGEKIKITGSEKSPLSWKVEGNQINEELSEWRLENIEILKKNNADSINNAVVRFVKENTDKNTAVVLMLCYYKRSGNEREYSELMAGLKGEAKNSEWLDISGRSDQMFHSYSYPAKLESMVMRSSKGVADTLETNHKNPIFLAMWQTGYLHRKELLDSLKGMEKEYHDSLRIIADICVDVDSIAWKNAMKKDSLSDITKRFWAPSGLTDPALRKLKVTALPYFIVFDKDGNQIYRGKNLKAALEEYRILQKENKE